MARARLLELTDELVEEVLLRLPPDDPAHLLRAALVCKRWRRLVAGCGFRRRYRELHRTPPVLGFVRNIYVINGPGSAYFDRTSSFRPPRAALFSWFVLHASHGRVLLFHELWGGTHLEYNRLIVWNPITDKHGSCPRCPGARAQPRRAGKPQCSAPPLMAATATTSTAAVALSLCSS
ncbi:hypothetical protein QOZ80_7AG0553700 [Eleusine coracana subsp. coracana]|nr:hypothetical protein QOZ80_7AG0553700 [Eleusine coracana subsp. coracana]